MPEPSADGAATAALAPVDALVVLPTLNHEGVLGAVLDALRTGLAGTTPAVKTAILVVDGGSWDQTVEVARAAAGLGGDVPVAVVELGGPPARSRALLGALDAVGRVGARAVALLDPSLGPAAATGIPALLEPVLEARAEVACPAHAFAPSEGTLTTNLLTPLARALYGRAPRRLLGGSVALAGGFLDRFLAEPPAETDHALYGVEVRLAVTALAEDTVVVEVPLGRRPSAGGAVPELPALVAGTVGPLFHLMARTQAAWLLPRGGRSVPCLGTPPGLVPDEGVVAVERMVRAFRLGLKDLLPVWEQVVPEDTLAQLYPLGLLAGDEFRFPAGLWARLVYDFALGYHERRLPRDHLLRALTPLYLGRVAGFLLEARHGAQGAALALAAVNRAFETEKPYLFARWR